MNAGSYVNVLPENDSVRLSEEERGICQEIVNKLKGTAQKVRRTQILLKADADGPGWTDAKIAEAFDCRVQTIENLAVQRYSSEAERRKSLAAIPFPPLPCTQGRVIVYDPIRGQAA